MLVLSCFPHHQDLVDCYKAYLAVVVLEMEHAIFNFQYLATQARRAAAINVQLLADVTS